MSIICESSSRSPDGAGNCEGMHCTTEEGELRLLPYSNGNCILCRSCYEYEIKHRRRMNEYIAANPTQVRHPEYRHSTPAWEDLTIYEEK